MIYKPFGNTGIQISQLGFGCMRFPGERVDGKFQPDQEKVTAMLRRAYDLGVNYFDTAPGYCDGNSEIAVGKALKDIRDKVYISTKCSINESGEDLRRNLEQSLRKLDTDYVDFYHFWGIGRNQYENLFPLKDGPVPAALKAKEEGLIRHLSFSFHDSPDIMMKIIDTGLFESVLCQFNLLDRANEEAIAYAREKGLGVVIMGPVAGGRIGAPSDTIASMLPGKVESSAEIALRFVMATKGVCCALSGMSTMEMVEENAKVASIETPLTEEEWRRIDKALDENKKLAELYCTGCKYCMPCPKGVNIPLNFEAMNYHKVYGLTQHAKNVYRDIKPEHDRGEKADKCVECGLCETKCPQKIQIRKQLKEVALALGES